METGIMLIQSTDELKKAVYKAVDSVKATDIHTHLFSPKFCELFSWGIDELLTYHYLIAETMRSTDLPYEDFWALSKKSQAELVWETLFIKNSPISEACRGVLSVLQKLGLDVSSRNLDSYRSYFENVRLKDYIGSVFEISGVESVVMTNDPFDNTERSVWLNHYKEDKKFRSALRVDTLLNSWDDSCEKLRGWGFNVQVELTETTIKEVRRFFTEWIDRMNALYMAASLPPDFVLPNNSFVSRIVEECIIPVSLEKNIPFAMMIGVKRGVNPSLRSAGDSLGKSSINTIEYLCQKYPKNKFLVTMLSRENQHELCVIARKFRNLLIFGCWWFLNNPSLIDEITRMRFELLGTSVIPQHSDCRILEQLIYKWVHSRKIIAQVLFEKYNDILSTGWIINEEEIQRDVENLFGGNFWRFLEKKL
jgi:hypothetical protein